MHILILLIASLFMCGFSTVGPVVGSTVQSTVASNPNTSTVCAYSPDWSTWDGSQDGVLVQDYLDGGLWNTGTYAPFDEDTAFHFYVEGNAAGNDYNLYSAKVTVDPCEKTLDVDSKQLIRNTGSVFGLPRAIQMTSTRYLGHQTLNTTGVTSFFLMDGDGILLSSANHPTNPLISGGYERMARHTDNLAVMAYRDRNTSDGFLISIDITDDDITFGSAVEFADSVTMKQPGISALTTSRGLVTTDTYAFRYTLSGTAVTVGTSFEISPSSTTVLADNGPSNAIKIDDNTVLVFAERSGDMYASVNTDDGSTQTKVDTVAVETEITQDWVANNLIQVQEYTGSQDGYYLGTVQVGGADAYVYMMKWDGTSITLEQTVNETNGNADAEHPTLFQFGNGAALLHYQDSTTWDWRVLTP